MGEPPATTPQLAWVAIKQVTPPRLRQSLQPRRFQLYGLGTARSGTTSVSELFARNYRAGHEAGSSRLLELFEQRQKGRCSEKAIVRALLQHNRQLWMEADASCFLALRPATLVSLFPDACFLVTIRECYGWLDSILNNNLEHPRSESEDTRRYHDVLFGGSELPHCKHDEHLAERGLHSIDAYLAYWARTNREILTQVPVDRRLVVRTHELGASTNEIARLVGIDPATLAVEKGHANRSKQQRVLATVDRAYVLDRIRFHCSDLMDEWFPGFAVPDHVFAPL